MKTRKLDSVTPEELAIENIRTYIQKLKSALKPFDEPHCNYVVEFDCTITELLEEATDKYINDLKGSLQKMRSDNVNGYHSELLKATKPIFHPHFEGVRAHYLEKLEKEDVL